MSNPLEITKAGAQLKMLRKRLGKKQTEMAKALRVSIAAYQRYERDERDLPRTVADRAQGEFNVSLDWLYEGTGRMFGPMPGGDALLAMEVPEGEELPDEDEDARRQYAQSVVSKALNGAGIAASTGLRIVMRNLLVRYRVPEIEIDDLAEAIKDELDRRGLKKIP